MARWRARVYSLFAISHLRAALFRFISSVLRQKLAMSIHRTVIGLAGDSRHHKLSPVEMVLRTLKHAHNFNHEPPVCSRFSHTASSAVQPNQYDMGTHKTTRLRRHSEPVTSQTASNQTQNSLLLRDSQFRPNLDGRIFYPFPGKFEQDTIAVHPNLVHNRVAYTNLMTPTEPANSLIRVKPVTLEEQENSLEALRSRGLPPVNFPHCSSFAEADKKHKICYVPYCWRALGLGEWDRTDEPWHKQAMISPSPSCQWLIRCRGPHYIGNVRLNESSIPALIQQEKSNTKEHDEVIFTLFLYVALYEFSVISISSFLALTANHFSSLFWPRMNWYRYGHRLKHMSAFQSHHIDECSFEEEETKIKTIGKTLESRKKPLKSRDINKQLLKNNTKTNLKTVGSGRRARECTDSDADDLSIHLTTNSGTNCKIYLHTCINVNKNSQSYVRISKVNFPSRITYRYKLVYCTN